MGLLGIAYETVVAGGDRPTLLVLFAAMVGLPAFLRGDEKTQDAVAAETPASVLGTVLSTAVEPPKEAP